MTDDHFDAQMNWVSDLADDKKVMAGTIVSWQAIATTLSELVRHFNNVTIETGEEKLRHHRQVQLKKIIIGMIYELDTCLDTFARQLNDRGMLDDRNKDLKKAFKTSCKKIGLDDLKQIRNGVAFHFAEILMDPNTLVDIYRLVDSIGLESLNEAVKASYDCGYPMREAALRAIG